MDTFIKFVMNRVRMVPYYKIKFGIPFKGYEPTLVKGTRINTFTLLISLANARGFIFKLAFFRLICYLIGYSEYEFEGLILYDSYLCSKG